MTHEPRVDSEVSYFRGVECCVHFGVVSGVTCHQCGAGETHTPGQTMDLPMIRRCLRCGLTAPTSEFDRAGGHGE